MPKKELITQRITEVLTNSNSGIQSSNNNQHTVTSSQTQVEAVVLALIAGTYNLAMFLSNYVGAGLLWLVGVSPAGEVGEGMAFNNLWIAQVVASILPLMTLVVRNGKSREVVVDNANLIMLIICR
jgi:hypothetical protein